MATHNINNKKQFPRYHLYTCMDGVNLFCAKPVSIGDKLIIQGEKYELGKGKGMSMQANRISNDGLYYQEFTLTRV